MIWKTAYRAVYAMKYILTLIYRESQIEAEKIVGEYYASKRWKQQDYRIAGVIDAGETSKGT
jgi:hypothetical protein